jgi:hypothetical protein
MRPPERVKTTQVWAKRYDGPAHRDDIACALGLAPTGRLCS